MKRWLLWAAVALSASAFTVHQHSQQQHCVDLQCPTVAFDYGIRNLVSEDTPRSDRCQACSQCTASGYSICLKMSDSRGRRGSQTEGCSCTHSVPANCHNEPSRAPPNMTMTTFNICYLSALQAPPRALAVNNKESVIVTVEPFWSEPYWRELQMENLTLHYEYAVQAPEHCEGDLITSEGDRVEHICKDSVKLDMDGALETTEQAKDLEDYEHSEGYQEYDESLPPEVAFDRDVFDGAKLLKVFYTVQVRRPRQLFSGSSDPFRDQTTLLDSEVLKFDLKPEIFGTGIAEDLPSPPKDESKEVLETTEPTPTEEDENVSEEQGDGTNFFEDDKKEQDKDTKSEEEQEKEEEEIEQKIEEEERASTTTTTEATTTEEEEQPTTTEEEEETTEKEESKEAEKTSGEEEEHKEDIEETDDQKTGSEEKDEEEESTTTTSDDGGATTTGDEEEDGEKEGGSEENEDGEVGEDGEQKPKRKMVNILGKVFNKYTLARWAFFITFSAALVFLVICCCVRKRCCRSEIKSTTTTSNGYRYNSASQRTDLVCPPEKERLHQ